MYPLREVKKKCLDVQENAKQPWVLSEITPSEIEKANTSYSCFGV